MDDNKVYVIGHKNPDTDSICAAIGYADYLNQRQSLGQGVVAVPARAGEINGETAFVLEHFKAETPVLLENAAGKKLVLVDHTEKSQMVDGADQAEILGVLDHHKVSFNYHSPIFFHAETIGATCTMVAKKFFEDEHLGVNLTPQLAGLLLSAILSDTVIFKSSTSTQKDNDAAKKLAPFAGIFDLESFGVELKKQGILRAGSVDELIKSGYKDFELAGNKIGTSQIEVVDLPSILTKRNDLLAGAKKIYDQGGFLMVVLMLTDIMKVGTEIIAVGDTTKLEETFGRKLVDNSFYASGMISRKKDLIPPLEKTLAK